MKPRSIFANICLSLLLLFAQHVALADAFSHVRHAGPEQTQCALEEGTTSNDSDSGNHVALDDLDGGLVSAFVFPALNLSLQSQAHSHSGNFVTVLSQFYSTRAPPTL
jgi:hypothetical protein